MKTRSLPKRPLLNLNSGTEAEPQRQVRTTDRAGVALGLVCLSLLLAGAWPLRAGPDAPPPPVPHFDPADFGPMPYVINNPWLPFVPGTTQIYEGETEDGFERIVVTVEEATRVVLGVECRVVLDRGYLDGELEEETYDWYAQDLAGNVWYFGEESHEIEDGKVVSTEGSWEAGIDGAQPGYIMLATPSVGDRYRQEFYEGEAEDVAEVTALGVSVTLRNGQVYTNALRTLEWTPLSPDSLENKYYVTGLGLVREEQADGSEPIDLVGDALPLKEAKLIIEHNATDEDSGFQGFIDSEGWQRLELTGPEGGLLLTLEGLGVLGQLGLTELFFESVEPPNAEVPIDTILDKLPQGNYLVSGPTIELGESDGVTAGLLLFTHDIPAGPVLLTPEEEETVDSAEAVLMSWEPVTQTINGEPVEIVAYQLIVEKVGASHPHMIGKPASFSAYIPASVMQVELPVGFLERDSEYEWEVLAIEASGNQTLSSGSFDTGDAPDLPEPPENDPPNLKAAKLIIEHNATDEDTGFQGFVDSEGWQTLTLFSLDGSPLLHLQGHGELGDLGLTELFFETVEPPNAEEPLSEILARLPAGEYTISGDSMQNGEPGGLTSGTALLTHAIPAGPELLTPAEDATVPPKDLVMTWNPVMATIDGGPVTIIAYQLIIEEDQTPHPHHIGKIGLSMYLPPTVTSVQVPDELLAPGQAYDWEVLAIEESGNQTLSSGAFTTTSAPMATPSTNHFVLSKQFGLPRHNFSGWVGMSVTVGPRPLEVTALGRIVAPGNSDTHQMKILEADTGQEVPGTSVDLLLADGNAGAFQYAHLAAPVLLQEGKTYYVLSQERAGGDIWYDLDTSITTARGATQNGAVYIVGAQPALVVAGPGRSYGPVDFLYRTTDTTTQVGESCFLLSYITGVVRNDFSGFVGMKIIVGPQPIRLTQLGRLSAPGNAEIHVLNVFRVNDRAELGSVTVDMAGAIPGEFVYEALPAPIELAPHTAYFVVSAETAGRDSFHDVNTRVQGTPIAAVSGGAFQGSGYSWTVAGFAGQSYGPVDFKYESAFSQPGSGGAVGPLLYTERVGKAARLILIGKPGERYALQTTTDLVHWEEFRQVSAPFDEVIEIESATEDRFFRAAILDGQ